MNIWRYLQTAIFVLAALLLLIGPTVAQHGETYGRRSDKQNAIRELPRGTLLLTQAKAISPAAASQVWGGVMNAANMEGMVVVYSSQPTPIQDRLKLDFEKAYPGIRLEISRIAGAALLARIEQEFQSRADGADVAVTTDLRWLEELTTKGLTQRLSGPSTSAWPSSYLKQGAVAVITLDPWVIVYNTKSVKVPIAGYKDFLRADLMDGRIATLEMVASSIAGWYDWLEKTEGTGFLQKLSAQKPRLFASIATSTQSVAAGEVIANIGAQPSVVLPLIEQGAQIKMVVPNPSLGVAMGATALAGTKRSNAALVFLDYLMSRRAQGVICSKSDCASPLTDIPGSLDSKTMTLLDTTPYTSDVMNTYKNRFNALFKK